MGKRFEITIKDDIAGQTLNDFFNRIGVGKERKRSLINKNLCFKNLHYHKNSDNIKMYIKMEVYTRAY